MSSRSQNFCGRVAVVRLAVVVVLCSLGTLAAAQDQPAPKWELFGGYSFFDPATNVHGLLPGGLLPVSSRVESNPQGVGGSVTYNFNRWFGLTADGSGNWGSGENGVSGRIDDAAFYSAQMGPKLTYRTHYVSPFVEALVGWQSLDSDLFQSDNGFGFMVGGGLDLNLNRRFALRLIRGDFVYSNHQYGPSSIVPATDVRGVRLESGVVFMFGGKSSPPPVSASCTVNPGEVMVGEPVTATATGSNFNPKHTLSYTWSSTGGKIIGTNSTASVDTNGVAGGSYTVTAHISGPRMKKGGEASCMATFTVKEPPKNPPTMTCSASPASLQAGGNSTITCTCSSPDNVPVTIAGWTASSGSVSGSGNTANLNTSGASPGPITVSATCTDSRGLNTQAFTQLTVENPPPPPPTPQASKLTDCDFENMAKIGKPWRVDNECKGKLDDVAKNLQQNADNKLVIVGNAEPTEKRKNLAAERAVNSKAYLTGGEAKLGIDPSRIETRTGSAGTKTAEYWIVPAGATFSGEGTHLVDESKVKAVPDHPAHPAAKEKAKAAQ
jgi:hypothetical protein